MWEIFRRVLLFSIYIQINVAVGTKLADYMTIVKNDGCVLNPRNKRTKLCLPE